MGARLLKLNGFMEPCWTHLKSPKAAIFTSASPPSRSISYPYPLSPKLTTSLQDLASLHTLSPSSPRPLCHCLEGWIWVLSWAAPSPCWDTHLMAHASVALCIPPARGWGGKTHLVKNRRMRFIWGLRGLRCLETEFKLPWKRPA